MALYPESKKEEKKEIREFSQYVFKNQRKRLFSISNHISFRATFLYYLLHTYYYDKEC